MIFLTNGNLHSKTILIASLLLLTAGMVFPTLVEGAASNPSWSADITNGLVHTSITLNMIQNLTAYDGAFSLPQMSGVFQGANSSGITGLVQAAIAAKTTGAKVSNLVLGAGSTSWSNTTSTQWFNISLSFDIGGIQKPVSGNSQVDMGWKSFAVTSNVTIGAYEVNNIGASYFVPAAGRLVTQSQGGPSSPIRFQFLVNGHPLLPSTLPTLVRDVQVLNFSTIDIPVSKWTTAYEPDNLVSWSFRGGLLGLEVLTTVNEPGQSTRAFYGLFYRLTTKLTAPARSSALGDSITVVFSDTPETLMAVSILAVSGVGAVAYFSERRMVRKPTKKQSRR